MNSFETDLKRAVLSIPFVLGVFLELIILQSSGVDSDLFRICVPILATFPYSTAWLQDYQSGFIKYYVSRSGIPQYIFGKILVCGISGGALELTGMFLYSWVGESAKEAMHLELIFVSGMLWAILSATLAAWSNNKYIAYGGSFVIYYLLVILHDRYFENLYCLYPYEWINPKHTWVFEKQGIIILQVGIMLLLICIYYEILRRCIERV